MAITKLPRYLNGTPSILLDSLRIVAALTVFLVHLYAQWFSVNGYIYTRPDLGHSAVVIFFVLSGYVIAHTTTGNNRGALQYASARLSRLYSVVLPAIIVTAVAQIITTYLSPQLAANYSRGSDIVRYLSSLFFSSELWFHSTSPPINGPLWSLSFEFWYYVIFGAFFYRTKLRGGWLLTLLLCFVAGPKIMILMPIWITGNLAYTLPRPSLSVPLRWVLVFVFLLLAFLSVLYVPEAPLPLGTAPWFWSAMFVTDWLTGLFIGLALWVLPTEKKDNREAPKWTHLFRKLADLTFPIYVMHMPLLIAWRAIFGTKYYDLPQMFAAFFSVLAVCILLGSVFEKYRYAWSRLFTSLFLIAKRVTGTMYRI